MSTLVVIEVLVKPEDVSGAKALFAETLPDIRAYDGCERAEAYSSTENPRDMLLVECWDSEVKQGKHLAWRMETKFADRMSTMIAKPPNIRHFERIDQQSCSEMWNGY